MNAHKKSLRNKKLRGETHSRLCHDDNKIVPVTIRSAETNREQTDACVWQSCPDITCRLITITYLVNENNSKNCVNCFHGSLQGCDIINKHCFSHRHWLLQPKPSAVLHLLYLGVAQKVAETNLQTFPSALVENTSNFSIAATPD